MVFQRRDDLVDRRLVGVIEVQLVRIQRAHPLGVRLVDHGLVGGVVVLLALVQAVVGAGDVAVNQLAVVGVETIVRGDLQVAQQGGQIGRRRIGQGALGEDVAADHLGLLDRPHHALGHGVVGRADVLLRRIGVAELHPQLTARMAVEALNPRRRRVVFAVHPTAVAPAGRLIGHVARQHGQEAVQRVPRRLRHVADQIQVPAIGRRRGAELELVAGVVEIDLGVGRRNLGLLAAEQVPDQCAEYEANEGTDARRNEITKQPSRISRKPQARSNTRPKGRPCTTDYRGSPGACSRTDRG